MHSRDRIRCFLAKCGVAFVFYADWDIFPVLRRRVTPDNCPRDRSTARKGSLIPHVPFSYRAASMVMIRFLVFCIASLLAPASEANAAGVTANVVGDCFPAPAGENPWMMFGGRKGPSSSRVDVNTQTGSVWYRGKSADTTGSESHSISGVHYAPFGRTELDTNAPYWVFWRGNGRHWTPPELYCDSRGLVVLSGLLKGPESARLRFDNAIGYLPERCRPQGRLIFPVRSDYGDARIDVRADGDVRWIAGPDSASNEVTLSGITFTAASKKKTNLELRNPWKQPEHEFENAQYVCEDGLVILSGLVERTQATRDSYIAQLPVECRPSDGALTFSVMSRGERSESVVIDTEGKIEWKGDVDSTTFWVSLSGIVFANGGKSPYDPNGLGRGFKPPQTFYANPRYACGAWRGAIVVIEGTLIGSGVSMIELPISQSKPRPLPSVKVSNPLKVVSSYSMDFGISVQHSTCRPHVEDCDLGEFPSADEDLEKLRCEVRVQKQQEDCKTFGRHMPCRKWDNFFPSTLEMTDRSGRLIPGIYDVLYACYGAYEQREQMTKLHSFRIDPGCVFELPRAGSSRNQFENVARHLLLSAPELRGVNCHDSASVYRAKEAVFRLHDNNPTDGVLSYQEILAALSKQSADSHIVSRWNEEMSGKLSIKLSHVMNARIDDMACGVGRIVFDSTVYPLDDPGRETDEADCKHNSTNMRVTWHYNSELSAGDYTCLYVDGVLYDKLMVTFAEPNSIGYSKIQNSLFAPTEINDIRPISGTFDDVQQSLVANFLFDDVEDEYSSIKSASPFVAGQKGSTPTLIPLGERRRQISACTGGEGARCLKEVHPQWDGAYGFTYYGELPSLDVAITSWLYSSCSGGSTDISGKTIALFEGKSHSLRFYLDGQSTDSSTMDLKVVLSAENGEVSSLTIGGAECQKWHQVGFALNGHDGLVLFMNLEGGVHDVTSSNTYKTTKFYGAGEFLSRMSRLELLGATGVEFDDVRVYTGRVSRATFLDAYHCGRRPFCAQRAHATPSSRRVVCASVAIQNDVESSSEFFCASAMYYDGSAIDVAATLDMSGVSFSFRDTAIGESSFEMLRRPAGLGDAAAKYETVIQMEGDLKSCGNKFSSITFLDRTAGKKPNLEWFYKVRTKMPPSSGLSGYVSTTHYFKAPWMASLAGKVFAGKSQAPVPRVRVCADFILTDGSLSSSVQVDTIVNLALYMKTEHSGNLTRTADEDTFLITDGDASVSAGGSLVRSNEYLRVELSGWSGVQTVEVCADRISDALQSVKAYIQDEVGLGAIDFGKECLRSTNEAEMHGACVSFACRTMQIEAFHGKYVTIFNAIGHDVRVTEILARGFQTKCAFTAVTDDFGRYSVELRDTSGRIPQEATLVTAAYKEDLLSSANHDEGQNVVVHVFDKDANKNPSLNAKQLFRAVSIMKPDLPLGNVVQVTHQTQMNHDFLDETTAVVRGAVLFPKDKTAGSTSCGLFEAVIQVKEVDGTDETMEVKTDESGNFEIALTRGNSFEFNATFPKHTICYTGSEIELAANTMSCDYLSQTVTIANLGDGHTIFFTDVTQANVDLGVYQGQCDALYSGVTFAVTPVNGCHKTVYVTSDDVKTWTNARSLPEEKFTNEHPIPANARIWPFAAMDYLITLKSGANVGGIKEMIKEESWNDSCAAENGDMLQFFERRNSLQRLAQMRNRSEWVQIQYNYHGPICIDIPDSYIPKIANDADVCYSGTEPSGGLSKQHFLGTSMSAQNPIKEAISDAKSIQLKVFELHRVNGAYERCFAALPSNQNGTGSTKIKIRQDVSDPGDTECHPIRGGGESCDFQVVLNDEGFLIFPEGKTELNIKAGQPNLAGNHRRTLRIEVERYDLYRSVTATAVRELIPLGSKPRGDDGAAFWATVPLDGLVYTVVHDPPGGDSYAELSSGSEVKIEYALASTRAMTVKTGTFTDSAFGFAAEGEFGMNLGYTAEASTDLVEYEVKTGLTGEAEVDGPNFSIESESDSGWDIVMTTNRVVRSSQDPALPGRAGDAILGGGIELVYKISDILDLSDQQDGGVVCLDVEAQVTWLPRKPTTYVFVAHAIEGQILPNLKFLLTTVSSPTGVTADESGKPSDIPWSEYIQRKITSWERTLEWATPEGDSKIQVSLTGDDSIFGKNIQSKMENSGGMGYNDLYTQDADFDDVATDLANEWASATAIDVLQGAPMYLLASVTMLAGAGPLVAQTAALGPTAYIQEARLLPFMRSDLDSHPVPGSDEPGHFPYSALSIVHPIARSEVVKPRYDDILKDENGETFYSYGMNDIAAEDMDDWRDSKISSFTGTVDNVSEQGSSSVLRPSDSKRILASLTGGTAPVAMANGGGSDQPDAQIFLTFSGGGHAMEFSFNSREAICDYKSHVSFTIDGAVDYKGGFHGDGGLMTPAGGIYYDRNIGLKYGWEREFAHDRMFMWNKYGHLTTTYSLGDPEYGDKFVVAVGSDRRFGTPVFVTKGGRSMCPGESHTVFRESGVSLEIPLKSKMTTKNLNPGERAMIGVVIKNESPYREGGKFALRLVDGFAASLDAVVSAAFEHAMSESANANTVCSEVIRAAGSTMARDSPEIAQVRAAAEEATSLIDATAQSVANAVFRAASSVSRDGFEMRDSIFSLNGNSFSIGDYMPFKFVSGDILDRQKLISRQHLSFAVAPGFATRSIKYLQLKLTSLCESDMDLYREPISHTVDLDAMSWMQPCPKVQFDEATMSKYSFSAQSLSSSGVLSLKVNNPDQYVLWPDADVSDALMNERLKLVRLQYRPASGGEWITAKDEGSAEIDKKFNLLCEHSRTEGCTFDWKINNQFEKLLSGFKDDTYELRVKNFCFGGSALADPSIHEYASDQRLSLIVDTTYPMEMKHFESSGRFFGIEYAEEIDCSDQVVTIKKTNTICGSTLSSTKVSSQVSAFALRNSFKFQCSNGKWIVAFPSSESGEYTVSVHGVTDRSGNVAHDFELAVSANCVTSKRSTAALGNAALTGAKKRDEGVSLVSRPVVFIVLLASMTLGGAVLFSLTKKRREQTDEEESHVCSKLGPKIAPSYGATL